MMIIEIFSIGCKTCQRMEAEVREIVQQMRLDAQVKRVEDLERFLLVGLTALPGLVIDGQLVACGYFGRGKLERILRQAAAAGSDKEKK